MSSLFVLIPFIAIVAMITYKALQIRGGEEEGGEEIPNLPYVSYLLKEKVLPKLEKIYLRTCCLFSEKSRFIHKTLKKNIYGHYLAFNDAVNGREDICNGGAASFFLKSVTDYKKKLRNRK